MNDVKFKVETRKNIEKYCNNCSSCGSGYNDPKWDIKKKIEQISSLPLIRYLTENELRHAFLGCYNPKEDVK